MANKNYFQNVFMVINKVNLYLLNFVINFISIMLVYFNSELEYYYEQFAKALIKNLQINLHLFILFALITIFIFILQLMFPKPIHFL